MRFSRTRLRAVAWKEFTQLRRDARSLVLAFVLPALLLVLFGYAITWDVDEIKLAVVDEDGSAQSRDLIASFQAAGYFELVAMPARRAAILPLLDRGDILLALVIPPDFAADLGAGRRATVQALVDGSDANTATIALGYTQAIVQSFSRRAQLRGAAIMTAAVTPAVIAESRVWYNEELRSRNMIVPGLIAVIMMIIAAMLTSLTIAREWERGTMEQLVATPVTRLEVVLGKLLPYLAIGLADVIAIAILGVVLFGVPFRGSPALLLVLSFFFLVGSLGLGMFISAASRSQLLATQMAMVLTFLPAYLLSGFMFALAVMPRPLRLLSLVVPARYFLVVTRGILLKGIGIAELHVQGLLMLAYAAAGLALAVRAFRKELQ